MRTVFKMGIKLPIAGVQYSNIETGIEWEIEGENAEELMKELKIKIDAFTRDVSEQSSTKFASLIEDQNRKLETAREEFIKLKNKEQ